MNKATVNHIEETPQFNNSDGSGDFTVFATASTSAIRRKVLINDMCVDILIDTRCWSRCIAFVTWVPVDVKPCTAAVQAWGKFDIPVCGRATCTHELQKVELLQQDFIIVKFPASNGKMLPLFNLELCQCLRMIRELLTHQTISMCSNPMAIFSQDSGVLNTGFEYKIPADGNILPKNIPACYLPPVVMEPVHKELKHMEHNNVIHPITEPTKWCSPMLIMQKKSSDICLVVDFRELNKAVQRQTYQNTSARWHAATAEEFQAVLFSWWCIRLPADTSPCRLLKHCWHLAPHLVATASSDLPFGICSTPELYQMLISQVLSWSPRSHLLSGWHSHLCRKQRGAWFTTTRNLRQTLLCRSEAQQVQMQDLHFQTRIFSVIVSQLMA